MINNIKELIEDGHPVSKIAIKLNIPVKEVKLIKEKHNLSLKHEEFLNTPEQIEYICKLYSEGISAKELGKKFKIDKRRVLKWAKSVEILRSKKETNRLYSVNENIFDEINTPEKAYW